MDEDEETNCPGIALDRLVLCTFCATFSGDDVFTVC